MAISNQSPGWFYKKTSELQDTLNKREAALEKFGRELNSEISKSPLNNDRESLQQYWQKVLEDNRKQEERNKSLLRKLGQVEEHVASLSHKTAALNSLREQYSSMMKILSSMNPDLMPGTTKSQQILSPSKKNISKTVNSSQESIFSDSRNINFSYYSEKNGSHLAILIRHVATQTDPCDPPVCAKCGNNVVDRSDQAVRDQLFRRVQSVSDLLGMTGLPKPPTPYPRMSNFSSMSSLSSQNVLPSDSWRRGSELGHSKHLSFESLDFLSPIHSPEGLRRNEAPEMDTNLLNEVLSSVPRSNSTFSLVSKQRDDTRNSVGMENANSSAFHRVNTSVPQPKEASDLNHSSFKLSTDDRTQKNDAQVTSNSEANVEKFVDNSNSLPLSSIKSNHEKMEVNLGGSYTLNSSTPNRVILEEKRASENVSSADKVGSENFVEKHSEILNTTSTVGDHSNNKANQNSPSHEKHTKVTVLEQDAQTEEMKLTKDVGAVTVTEGEIAVSKIIPSTNTNSESLSLRTEAVHSGNAKEKLAITGGKDELQVELSSEKNATENSSQEVIQQQEDKMNSSSNCVETTSENLTPLPKLSEMSEMTSEKNDDKSSQKNPKLSDDEEEDSFFDKGSSLHGTEAYQMLLGKVPVKSKAAVAVDSLSESSDDIENAFFTSVLASNTASSDKPESGDLSISDSRIKDKEMDKTSTENVKVLTAEERQRVAKKVMHLGSSSESDVNLPPAKDDSDSDDFFN